MATVTQHPFTAQQNQLLLALPPVDRSRWQSRLELVELSLNQVLCAAGQAPEYVYFPTSAIVSLMSITREGSSAEVALVGNDGVVGITALLAFLNDRYLRLQPSIGLLLMAIPGRANGHPAATRTH